jgi:transcriptional regulator with XRE-family HTH domain
MLSRTLEDGLGRYAIGPKVRALRLKKKMGLVELGKHSGLSAALLSKLERGRLFPTLPTLLRIALVFGVGLEYFFAGPRDKPVIGVVRRRDRLRFPDKPGTRDPSYMFESLDYPATERRLSAYYAEFRPVPTDKLRWHDHPGGEFLYVLRGRLTIHVAEEEVSLDAGDSIYFDPSVPHAYRRSGSARCAAVVVTTA